MKFTRPGDRYWGKMAWDVLKGWSNSISQILLEAVNHCVQMGDQIQLSRALLQWWNWLLYVVDKARIHQPNHFWSGSKLQVEFASKHALPDCHYWGWWNDDGGEAPSLQQLFQFQLFQWTWWIPRWGAWVCVAGRRVSEDSGEWRFRWVVTPQSLINLVIPCSDPSPDAYPH